MEKFDFEMNLEKPEVSLGSFEISLENFESNFQNLYILKSDHHL